MSNYPHFDGLCEGESLDIGGQSPVLLGKVLGSGGYGRVFEAIIDGRLRAAKSIRHGTDSIAIKTKAEIAILKSCTSSGFTPEFYGSFDKPLSVTDHTSEFYRSPDNVKVTLIFMELMGPSLHDVMERNKKTGQFFSTSDIMKIGNQICHALSYLNSMGYIHGDIKPKNVCLSLDDSFKVKLIDFGEVSRIDELTDKTRFGTCSYWSPQVLHGFPLDEKLDIWSLGCLLAELRLGEKLFPGRNDAEVYKLHNFWGLHIPFGTALGQYTYSINSKTCTMSIDENRHPTMQGHICKNRNISTLNIGERLLVKYIIMPMLEYSPKDRPSAAELCK